MAVQNLLPNPTFAVNANSWLGSRASAKIASGGVDGGSFGRVTSVSGDTSIFASAAFPVTPGQVYSARQPVKTPNIGAGKFAIACIYWVDSNSSDMGVWVGTPQALTTAWQDALVEGAVAPAGAATGRLQTIVTNTSATSWPLANYAPTSGRQFDVDRAIVSQTATAVGYFDGDSLGAAWMGAAHASPSVLLTPALTASSDAPCPRVEVLFDLLPPAVASLTLMRTAGGRREQVRGAVRAATSGALARIDFEVPMDVPATYRAEMFNAAGVSLGVTGEATITVPSPTWPDGKARICVHNPLEPTTAVWVLLKPSGGATRSIEVAGEATYPQGRTLGVVSTSGRRGMVAVPIDVVTETFDDGERFDALFGEGHGADVQRRYPVLCVRIPSALRRIRWPAMWMAGVLSAVAETHHWDDRLVWRMQGREVAPPVPALVVPLLRRKDIAAFYASRQAVANDNATRLRVSRRYELGGVGGD